MEAGGSSPVGRGAKVARATTLSRPSPGNNRIDWASLGDGPAGLVAERLLAHDVADYLRFRAVCSPWRRYSPDPRTFSCLDRRFHPGRRWILLREPLCEDPTQRRFLSLSTGQCIKVHLPELADHHALAVTPEGLLVLLHNDRTRVCLLNPRTGHLTELPQLTTLLPQVMQDHFLHTNAAVSYYFPAWGSGILNDGSTVVLSFSRLNMIGIAKPGDARWILLKFDNSMQTTSLVLAGRFYCVTATGVMVLEDQPPRLELAAYLPMGVSDADSLHLVDIAGELMLVHRSFSRLPECYSMPKMTYDVYRLDLYAGTLCRVSSFGGGGHALFLGTRCSLAVPIEVFPTGSIRGDTIYLSFDIDERCHTEGYHLADGSITPAACNILDPRSVAQPHTLIDCLSFCSNSRI